MTPKLLAHADVIVRNTTTDPEVEQMRVIRNTCAPMMTRHTEQISPDQQKAWWASLDRTRLQPKLVFLRDELVGYAITRIDEHGHIYLTVGLKPEARGIGVGEVVFRKLIADVPDVTSIRLEVREDNITALKLYRKLGFVVDDYTETPRIKFFTLRLPEAPPLVSIIFGTFNRLPLLRRCMKGLEDALEGAGVPYEFVICDGGSSDGSREWLAAHPRVLLIAERRLEGAVKAFNQAYSLSRAPYVLVLNDDIALLEPRGLLEGIELIQKLRHVGQIAFGFRRGNHERIISGSVAGHFYANLGLIRRDVADMIAYVTGGLWSPVYHTYGADTELSCLVERAGLQVHPIRRSIFHDLVHADELRKLNNQKAAAIRDNRTFWGRWHAIECAKPGGPAPYFTPAELERLKETMG